MSDSPQSQGGQARAKKLPPEERRRIASEAARARWSDAGDLNVHVADFVGPVHIGDLEFRAAVLNDGTRLISGTQFMKTMGIYRSGALSTRRDGAEAPFRVPLFLAHKNLLPFVLEDEELVQALSAPVLYRESESRLIAEGIKADVLPRICRVWVRARDAGVLGHSQAAVAERAAILLHALENTAIIALIDEATGYQRVRARDELQKILAAYISAELLPWAKMFPDDFYEQLHRVHGWRYAPGSTARSSYIGKLTNELIYERMPPGILDELRRKNPVDRRTKRRRKKNFQFLTEDIGHPHLEKQIVAVTTLLRVSPDRTTFKRLFSRAFPPRQGELFAFLDEPLDAEDAQEPQNSK